ncbi:uncharacterized protein BDZ83DRAFT_20753 [Colletotrichum acutatum]|uniref:Uncharacterized protein n=1 Tax=Glomerella acutata TaxID=27357 RepID=A0AAD8UGJ4_GLOAC|nr:uncharacterized protein BDZ83DRAFT_20753 [Colletotrichum acutatum]KAK1718131.1 hypothetical protein BDZ83DRAFT_20753 [Colletotrichum acutatum]
MGLLNHPPSRHGAAFMNRRSANAGWNHTKEALNTFPIVFNYMNRAMEPKLWTTAWEYPGFRRIQVEQVSRTNPPPPHCAFRTRRRCQRTWETCRGGCVSRMRRSRKKERGEKAVVRTLKSDKHKPEYRSPLPCARHFSLVPPFPCQCPSAISPEWEVVTVVLDMVVDATSVGGTPVWFVPSVVVLMYAGQLSSFPSSKGCH